MLVFLIYAVLRMLIGIVLVILAYSIAIRDTTDLILQLFCIYFMCYGMSSALFHFLLVIFNMMTRKLLKEQIAEEYDYYPETFDVE